MQLMKELKEALIIIQTEVEVPYKFLPTVIVSPVGYNGLDQPIILSIYLNRYNHRSEP